MKFYISGFDLRSRIEQDPHALQKCLWNTGFRWNRSLIEPFILDDQWNFCSPKDIKVSVEGDALVFESDL